ncbi:MAG: hypothetical protein COB42_01720 [Sulfurimonas sp.]|nr:MAG: hypothetical protein COB42_01720 [Sulfurimonas sp.]
MYSFYFYLWLRWALRVSLCSIVLALVGALFVTVFIYIQQGLPTLRVEVYLALFDIMIFWFPLMWSLSLLVALFRSLKHIFNVEIKGYRLALLECSSKEELYDIGYGDIVKVWRKWFMVMIWLVACQILLGSVLVYMFTSYASVLEWLNIYFLFLFVLLSGYFSFILLGGRCKKVKLVKC